MTPDEERREEFVRLMLDGITLKGIRNVPEGARGLVVFVHGSGSSRLSPRNRYVARALEVKGLATLRFDLLTREEEREDARTARLRFDIPRLSARLVSVLDWIAREETRPALRVGLFGASTGSAAALIAASERPETIWAVVSRGGRPDLAEDVLPSVRAPTLFLVGSEDRSVLRLNRRAFERLRCPRRLTLVPGASHLFEERGALERVAHLAGDWFLEHLGAPSSSSGSSESPESVSGLERRSPWR